MVKIITIARYIKEVLREIRTWRCLYVTQLLGSVKNLKTEKTELKFAQFEIVKLQNNVVVTVKYFENINKICLNSTIFSTHSFRRGGATLLFRAKVSADKIHLMGDWKSDAYKRYLAYTLEDKIQISKVIDQYIVENSSVSSRK